MKLHEYQAKELLAKWDMPVMPGKVAAAAADVPAIIDEVGLPAVLKAQVHVGGRGKAGGIKIVDSKDDAVATAEAILNLTIKDLPVKKLLVTKACDIDREFYFGIIFDRENRTSTMILSGEGGVDIEETAQEKPEAIHKISSDERGLIYDFQVRRAAAAMGVPRELHNKFIKLALALFDMFKGMDLNLLEINPLVVTDQGELVLVDAKIITDDNAMYRQKDIKEFEQKDPESPDEVKAKEYGLSYVKLDGNVGCIVNGAGLAMATMDVIKHFGGEPANFLDIGGSSNTEKMKQAMKLILSDENVKSILINIFGGITRCDDVAAGFIEALKSENIDRPVYIRLSGTNEELAREMLEKEGVSADTRMEDAVRKAVAVE